MKTAAAYIRVSDSRQDEYSPASQLKLIKDYATKNGYFVPEEFIFYDDGISGTSTKKRTQFNNMIGFAKEKNPPFSAILVWKFSRFARNQEESIVFKKMLKKNGISVISISEPIGDDAFSTLIERIIEWMDEYYIIRLSPEVKRGMKERASRGEPVSVAPFGYKMINSEYIPDPDTAPFVEKIFKDYASGKGMRAIAYEISACGARTIRGNTFDNRGIEYILNNPVYKGKLRWSPDGKQASKRIYNEDKFMIIDGKHEAIISEELYEAAQTRLRREKELHRPRQKKEHPAEYMLKGLVRCSSCGATLCLTHTKSPGLQCHQYAKGKCTTSHNISLSKANAAVIEAIEQAALTDMFTLSPKASSSYEAPTDYDALIKAAEKKLSRLTAAYIDGAYTLEQLKPLKTALDKEISELKSQKEEQASHSPDTAEEEKRAAFRQKLKEILPTLKSTSVSESAKNEILRTILDHITFSRPTTTFTLHFHI